MHPFDFNGEDLAEIKKNFPEFKPKRSKTRTTSKVNGLLIDELKKKLASMIHIDSKHMKELIEKLDHKNSEKVRVYFLWFRLLGANFCFF